MITNLPEKTIERLSQYRRVLLSTNSNQKHYIFSHELAKLMHITPVQVRRDLMLIGYSGTLRKGYDIVELITRIGKILDPEEGLKVALVGMGNLGRAVTTYFNGKRSKLKIVAAFDVDPSVVNRVISGVKCYPADQISEILKSEDVQIAIITTPPEVTAYIAEKLVMSGIRGILNYTPTPINVPSHVFLEEYDMVTSIEKVAYFVKKAENN